MERNLNYKEWPHLPRFTILILESIWYISSAHECMNGTLRSSKWDPCFGVNY